MSYHCQDVDKIGLTLGMAFVLQPYLQSHNDPKVEPIVGLSLLSGARALYPVASYVVSCSH